MDNTCPPNDARHAPGKCLGRIVMDALIIAGAYAALSVALGNSSAVSVDGTVTFFVVFIPLAYFLKLLDVEWHDQLSKVAAFQLGIKVFNTLSTGPL